eukprot:469350_1
MKFNRSQRGVGSGFINDFKAGSVMGFILCSFGGLVLFYMIKLFQLFYSYIATDPLQTKNLIEAVAGFGLGVSSVGIFGRVGGGIYTNAADVGVDLVGKVELSGNP